MEQNIRKVTEKDFDDIYPLFVQLWPTKPIDKTALRTIFNRGVNSENDVLLCFENSEKIIGFCSYAIVNNLWQEGYISYVYALVVDEKYRGNGIGTMLINAAIDDSKKRGLKRLELDSAFHREKAHQFYEKMGFEKRAFLFSYKTN